MHELSVTEAILELALRYAQEAKAKRIQALNLRIGQLSSIVDESVQFYWDIISKDTLAERAVLNFTRIPAQFTCRDCGNDYFLEGDLSCPRCKGANVRVTAGEEFQLESIDIE